MAGDPLWYYKVLGLHCDGTNGSTTFTDVKGKTVTANGNAQISTAQYPALTGKTSSGYFDGTGDYLSIPDNSDFEFGSGNFSVKCFIRIGGWSPGYGGVYYSTIFCKETGSARSYSLNLIGTSTSFTTLRFSGFSDNSNYTDISGSFSFSLDTWYEVLVTRSGNLIYLFVNGTLLNSGGTSFSRTLQDTAQDFKIGGGVLDATYLGYFFGYISEFEVYKGVGLHTASYTPSTDTFGDGYLPSSGVVALTGNAPTLTGTSSDRPMLFCAC